MFMLSIVGGFFRKILSDPKVIMVLLLLIVIGVVYFKFSSLQSELAARRADLQHQVEVSAALRTDLTTATDANKNNQTVIEQLRKDRNDIEELNKKLSASAAKTDAALREVQRGLDAIKTPPAPLSPYIAAAVEGIQRQRDAADQLDQSAPGASK